MKNNENNIFDYYNNWPSYVKIILDMIPDGIISIGTKSKFRNMYNQVLANSSADEISDIITSSALFGAKISRYNDIDAFNTLEHIYNIYMVRILNDLSAFDKLNDYIKSFVNDYVEELNVEKVGRVR